MSTQCSFSSFRSCLVSVYEYMLSIPRPKDITYIQVIPDARYHWRSQYFVQVVVVWESNWTAEKALPSLTSQRLFYSLCYYLEEFQDLSETLTLNLQARPASAWLSIDNASEQPTQSALSRFKFKLVATAPWTQALMLRVYRHLL